MSCLNSTAIPWRALYVKSRHEKCVSRTLCLKGYESFLPTYVKANKKKSELPLFPGYVFCRFESEKLLPILTTPGVFSVVSNGPTLAYIPECDVERVRVMLSSKRVLRPWPYITKGRQALIKSGPLQGMEGVIVNDTHDRWLVLSVHILQRSVAVKIERTYID